MFTGISKVSMRSYLQCGNNLGTVFNYAVGGASAIFLLWAGVYNTKVMCLNRLPNVAAHVALTAQLGVARWPMANVYNPCRRASHVSFYASC